MVIDRTCRWGGATDPADDNDNEGQVWPLPQPQSDGGRAATEEAMLTLGERWRRANVAAAEVVVRSMEADWLDINWTTLFFGFVLLRLIQ